MAIGREPTWPESYRVLQSKNQSVCRHIETSVNERLRKTQREADIDGRYALFDSFDFAVKGWKPIQPSELPAYDLVGLPASRIEVDIDDDGTPETVVRAAGSVSGVYDDRIRIFSSSSGEGGRAQTGADKTGYAELTWSDYPKWYKRAQALYGNRWQDWVFGGQGTLSLARFHDRIYFIAFNYANPAYADAKIYVFRANRRGEIVEDICMLRRA